MWLFHGNQHALESEVGVRTCHVSLKFQVCYSPCFVDN